MGRSLNNWTQDLVTYGMIPWFITLVWFLTRVGDREKPFDWQYIKILFKAISPYFWSSLGIYVSIGTSILGAAWGMFATGTSLLGSALRAPHITSKNLISVIFCEAAAIYGVVVAIILQTKIENMAPDPNTGFYPHGAMFSGYSILASGLVSGFCNLVCGLCVGIVGSSCALSDAINSSLFVKILVIEIFASVLGLFGVIIGIMLSSNANFSWTPSAAQARWWRVLVRQCAWILEKRVFMFM
eukprot:TRINITY_DN30865_c0_g2_i2.p2 TRINITY_DN30865_c0_g2~~TRINITY_DN30865_c0_g2_i2.p2  ORF type:complete len:242 (-),score=1.71 TRINITY_DN30865_c0_g2_i2:344-1069(-)